MHQLAESYKTNFTLRQAIQIIKLIQNDIYTLGDTDGYGSSHDINFSQLQQRLESLIAQGHVDEVLGLAEELLEAGTSRNGI